MRYRFNQFILDTDRFELFQNGESLHVEPQVIELLVLLIENRDRMISRDEINEKIWKGRIVSEAALSSRIKIARQVLGDDGRKQQVIRTIHKKGFSFVADVDQEEMLTKEGKGSKSSVVDTKSADEKLIDKSARTEKPSIAVLAFTNMSNNPDQEYFSDGITEDIITELSRFPGLFVIAPNSSLAYKRESVDVRQVMQELKVRYLLDGSVRRSGKRVRINAQLVDAETENYIWTERYDRDLEDIFDLQEEITRQVVASVAPQIEMAEIAHANRSRSSNLPAYEMALYAQAQFRDAMRKGKPELLGRAIDLTEASLVKDPENVSALCTQAFVYYIRYVFRWGDKPDDSLNRANEVIEQVFEIDTLYPQAYTIRGCIRLLRGDYDNALADYRRAYDLNPNFATNIFWMADAEAYLGLSAEARQHAELALRLSPRDTDFNLGLAYLALATASFTEGNFEAARDWANQSIQMQSKVPVRRALIIACCGYLGDHETAKRHRLETSAFAPDFIPDIIAGKMTIFKNPEHSAMLIDGMRAAGVEE